MVYDEKQRMLALSFLVDLVFDHRGDKERIEKDLTKQLNSVFNNDTFQNLAGNWSLAWGPAVKEVFDKAANTMFVVKNSDETEYVIAIAGTNPASLYDWIILDGNVNDVVSLPWKNSATTSPKISKGTSIGFNNIYNELSSNGTTIQEFLTNTMSSTNKDNIQVITTGHSLGGALAPTLALCLSDLKNEWDKDGKALPIKTYPFAGTTAGDNNFAAYSGAQIGTGTYRIWNNLDYVPHSFQKELLEKIPNIYELKIKTPDIVKVRNKKNIETAEKFNYTQIQGNVTELSGIVKESRGLIEFTIFMREAIYQHMAAYIEMMNIKEMCQFYPEWFCQTPDELTIV